MISKIMKDYNIIFLEIKARNVVVVKVPRDTWYFKKHTFTSMSSFFFFNEFSSTVKRMCGNCVNISRLRRCVHWTKCMQSSYRMKIKRWVRINEKTDWYAVLILLIMVLSCVMQIPIWKQKSSRGGEPVIWVRRVRHNNEGGWSI